jgi:uncharacterized membrane protein YbjE (DUF340 family)
MLTVILIMTAGMIAGFLLRRRKELYKRLDQTVSIVIYLLLFLLGLTVGQNRTIVENFHLIGVKALLITLAAVAGSVILAAVAYRFLFQKEHKEHLKFREKFREERRMRSASGGAADSSIGEERV